MALAASALDECAVVRMVEIKGRAKNKPLTLAIKSAEEALDYAPDMCPLAQRLARRCWPGPITLVIDDSHPESLVRRLPPLVQKAVSPKNAIGLRVPGHQVILDVMRMLAGPLALSSANRSGRPEAVTAEEVSGQPGRRTRPGFGRRAMPFRAAFLGGSRARQTFRSPAARRGSPSARSSGFPV